VDPPHRPWWAGFGDRLRQTSTGDQPVRRFRPRSWRGATGLGLIGAAALLVPFLDEPNRWWIPFGLGFGTLVLLAVLRLDRLLKGWTWHVAGVVLVGALVSATSGNPWAWAFAVSVGVALAGLIRLPRWQLLAVGLVLVAVSLVGYRFRAADVREQQNQVAAQAGAQLQQSVGITRPALVLTNLTAGIQDPDAQRICRITQPAALVQLTEATGTGSCADAVGVLHARLTPGSESPITVPRAMSAAPLPPGSTTVVDACSTSWARAAGPALGKVELVRTAAARETYQIATFEPC
jgi:membrane protein implicated in regulation of membrane protease activity